MRAVRTVGLGVALFAGVLAASSFGAAPPVKHHHHQIHGVVVEIDHTKNKGHGLIKVRTHQNAKGQKAAAGKKGEHVVTVHVNHHTHFEKVTPSGKGNTKEVLAHFRDVEPGQHVRIKVNHDHHAQEVSILLEHKGKNKK
jgi:hypothetical protein